MQMQFKVGARRDFSQSSLSAMHALRARVFHDRLGWEVAVDAGMEVDVYDGAEAHYMLMLADDGLRGCWRLLPTLGPYMLKIQFAELLDGEIAPCAASTWELSRFTLRSDATGAYGFSGMTLQAIAAIIDHGKQQCWQRYVTVTTVAIERLLLRAGVVITRMGAPRSIGVARAVALTIDIPASWYALGLGAAGPYLGPAKRGMLCPLLQESGV